MESKNYIQEDEYTKSCSSYPGEENITAAEQKSWIKNGQEGDKEALLHLLDAYRPLFLRYGTEYANTADDFQELLSIFKVAFVEGLLRYDWEREVPFAGFIKSCIHGAALSYVRQKNRREKRETDTLPSELEYAVDDQCRWGLSATLIGNPVADTVERQWICETLQSILHHLTPEEQALIYDIYYKDKSIAACARELGVSRQTLYYRYKKLIKALRKAWCEMPFAGSLFTIKETKAKKGCH